MPGHGRPRVSGFRLGLGGHGLAPDRFSARGVAAHVDQLGELAEVEQKTRKRLSAPVSPSLQFASCRGPACHVPTMCDVGVCIQSRFVLQHQTSTRMPNAAVEVANVFLLRSRAHNHAKACAVWSMLDPSLLQGIYLNELSRVCQCRVAFTILFAHLLA